MWWAIKQNSYQADSGGVKLVCGLNRSLTQEQKREEAQKCSLHSHNNTEPQEPYWTH